MADKILNSFDVWIGAQGRKSKLRLRSVDNVSLVGITRLRELILKLAVRGKLVAQCASDEPAKILLDQMRKNKQFLIEKKKIRTPTELPLIKNDDIPFDLPSTWSWTYLSDIGQIVGGGTPNSSDNTYWSDKGIKWLTPADLYDLKGKFISSGKRDLSQEGLEKSSATLMPKGTVLFSSRAPIGYVGIAETELSTNQGFKSCVPYVNGISEYTYYFLKSAAKEIDRKASGTTFKEISGAGMAKLLFPLPPLKEQHRIVAKIDELMALCDELDQQETNHLKSHQLLVETLLGTLTQAKAAAEFQSAWARLAQHFDDLFITEDSIDQLKQTILQLAVMGKLVPQDPSDEPASELLKEIKKEKAKLIEKGKIKKEQPLPEIQESEIPFKTPVTWEFARLGEITNKIGSGSTPKGGRESYAREGFLFLRSQNIRDHGLELSDVAFISAETHERMSGTKVYPNDILLNITGGSLGRSTIFPDNAEEANVSQHVTIIRPTNPDTRFFLHLCLVSPYGQGLIWGRQVGANREGLSKKVLELFEIPIPPIDEQDRIMKKIADLFALCDRLKEKIRESQKVANLMANSILEQVI